MNRSPPSLRFSPTAWAKLLYLRDLGDTEVGGFGIARSDDLLMIDDFQLVRQECTAVTVAFDDAAVADFFDEQVDAGLHPQQFSRVWIHTHPGNSPEPSSVDEETFARVFGQNDWAVMFILACGGKSYCRLRFNAGPGGSVELPVMVDYGRPFDASDEDAWLQEYIDCVTEIRPQVSRYLPDRVRRRLDANWFDLWEEELEGPVVLETEDDY